MLVMVVVVIVVDILAAYYNGPFEGEAFWA